MSKRMTDVRAEQIEKVLRLNDMGDGADELSRARASEHEKTLENARLLNEREEMERMIEALADALLPFARYAAAREAKPIRGLADEIHEIHVGTEWEASIKLSDCHRAIGALAKAGRLP